MTNKHDIMPLPEKIKTPREELEAMAQLADTVYFKVLKRVARRYVENLKNQSFTLREEDKDFAIKHTRYVEQAVGMQLLIKIIADAESQMRKEEEQ